MFFVLYTARAGNGITDDTNAIQWALSDVVDMGDRTVFSCEGNYLIATQLILPAATI